MLRFGPDTGPVVVIALPLLEEANRVRAFAVTICRALAEAGVASALPDLPGTGESLTDGAGISLRDLREAFAAAVEQADEGRPVHCVAIRSGALLDRDAAFASRWHLAAQTGQRLVREWQRVVDASAREAGSASVRLDTAGSEETVDIAGHRMPGPLLAELADDPTKDLPANGPRRDVRLNDDPGSADLHITGTPLWRRAEPGNDPDLAEALADDIAQWVRACEGC